MASSSEGQVGIVYSFPWIPFVMRRELSQDEWDGSQGGVGGQSVLPAVKAGTCFPLSLEVWGQNSHLAKQISSAECESGANSRRLAVRGSSLWGWEWEWEWQCPEEFRQGLDLGEVLTAAGMRPLRSFVLSFVSVPFQSIIFLPHVLLCELLNLFLKNSFSFYSHIGCPPTKGPWPWPVPLPARLLAPPLTSSSTWPSPLLSSLCSMSLSHWDLPRPHHTLFKICKLCLQLEILIVILYFTFHLLIAPISFYCTIVFTYFRYCSFLPEKRQFYRVQLNETYVSFIVPTCM